ncbi:MAG: DUF4837 family protein [Bacteroidales bacterium]|nr:DUF4837 family protein [Bacteroidales bacterium]
MKRFLSYAIIALMALAITSCSSEKRKKALLPNISGHAGEVIVVIDKGDWEGAVGTTLRDTLGQDCKFLPQREPLYSLVNVIPSGFTNMFQIHRNIIVVNIKNDVTEPGVKLRQDIWAKPQIVISIDAKSSAEAVELIKDNSRLIISALEQAERDRLIANHKRYEERSLAEVVTKMIGGSPHFPSGYKLKKQTEDFIWISYDIQYVTQGILIYKYPVVESENMMSLDNILAENSEMLKANVPGMFEGTYMMTSEFARPSIEYMKFRGRDFAELRGFWEVYNDYMGGPFVAQAFYSKDGKYMIFMEGFVYAPKYDKRTYLRQVESILYSFEWAKDEKKEDK